ncbi:MAG TPA: BPSS1780 family membrane protein [Burkholderiales bacterium]|nr:BPSS1780 family membrane protein [Burkholderiales bacterium]
MSTNFIAEGHPVPAGHGWTWIAGGWELLKRRPGTWVAIAIIAIVIGIAFYFMRSFGTILSILLTPVFTAGFVIGAKALDEGRELKIAHLFAGFTNRFGALIAVGAIYLALLFAIVVVSALVTGVSVWVMLGAGPDLASATLSELAAYLLAWLIALALMVPVFMAVWFAPPLVVFDGLGALDALKASFRGCLKNIVPFLIYGLIVFGFAILASIPFLLGWLVLAPVIGASIYTSYRDIYFG